MRAFRHLLHEDRGVFAIETVVVAPLLLLMAIGIFEVGTMVSRQQELQSAASEAEGIILSLGSTGVIDPTGITNVIKSSLDPRGTRKDLAIEMEYRARCGTAAELVEDPTSCPEGTQAYRFVLLKISDRYDPVWARFGVAHGFDYNISRTIQIS